MEAKKCFLLLALGLVVLVASTSAMSIEAEPVKVTHRNSGPRYDIDRDEEPLADDRSKLTPVVEQPQPPTDNKDVAEKPDDMPMGHIHIRRIFLVPMMHPMGRPDNSGWQSEDNREEASEQPARPLVGRHEPGNEPPQMFAKPFWPFLTPARPAHRSHQQPHLFGADEASRSPTIGDGREQQDKATTNNVPATAGGEREDQPARPDEPTQGMFDPIQMMMQLMHQAMAGQLAPHQPPPSDLNKEAATTDERPKSPAELVPPMKPAGQNETREDVVEIEGKKFLRKTIINRHVGENIIFMTKRLIFVPLNETEPTTTVASNEQPAMPTTTTTTTTERANEEPTTTTTSITTAAATVDNKAVTEKPIEEATTTTTTTTTTMAPSTEQPPATTEVVVPDEKPSSTPAAEVEATTKESWVDRVSDAIDKAAERMVESAQPEATTTTTTTTLKPSN